jgi:hypothetical protein
MVVLYFALAAEHAVGLLATGPMNIFALRGNGGGGAAI